MRELSYKDTDKSIEVVIYGLNFKIDSKIENLNEEEINEKAKTDEKIIEKIIDEILGENAVKQINEQRIKDGHEEMSISVQAQVLNWIINQYAEEVLLPINNTVNKMQNYNRGYRRNKRNRYRRY